MLYQFVQTDGILFYFLPKNNFKIPNPACSFTHLKILYPTKIVATAATPPIKIVDPSISIICFNHLFCLGVFN